MLFFNIKRFHSQNNWFYVALQLPHNFLLFTTSTFLYQPRWHLKKILPYRRPRSLVPNPHGMSTLSLHISPILDETWPIQGITTFNLTQTTYSKQLMWVFPWLVLAPCLLGTTPPPLELESSWERCILHVAYNYDSSVASGRSAKEISPLDVSDNIRLQIMSFFNVSCLCLKDSNEYLIRTYFLASEFLRPSPIDKNREIQSW